MLMMACAECPQSSAFWGMVRRATPQNSFTQTDAKLEFWTVVMLFRRFSSKPLSLIGWLLLLVGGLFLLDFATYLLAEGIWFNQVNYLPVFQVRVWTQIGLAVVVFAISITYLWFNLRAADRHTQHELSSAAASRLSAQMDLRLLLPICIACALMVSVMVFYYGQIAISHWQPNLTVYGTTARIPIRFRPEALLQIGQQLSLHPWLLTVIVCVAGLTLFYPKHLLNAIAIPISLGIALIVSSHWTEILLSLSPTRFVQHDPIFGQNISFYLFRLPVLELFDFWLAALSTLTLFSVALIYLLANHTLEQGRFVGFTSTQQRHLHALGGMSMVSLALSNWLDRYEQLYSTTGANYGANYTDVHVELPVLTGLSLLALVTGLLLLAKALLWRRDRWNVSPVNVLSPRLPYSSSAYSVSNRRDRRSRSASRRPISRRNEWQMLLQRGYYVPSGDMVPHPMVMRPDAPITDARPTIDPLPRRGLAWFRRPLMLLIGLYGVGVVLGNGFAPLIVQQAVVQPNELQLETSYIANAIALTRDAYALDQIDEETFDPQGNLTYADLQENELTVKNIRLWDTRPLLETNRQLQRIRPYYEFPGADIDRYRILNANGGTEQRQVLIAARELDYNSVPSEAKTWVNRHLIYTHGYGFTMSPVNTAGASGLPDYFIRGIEHSVSDPLIAASIPIGQPRIYFGELTNTYVMTNTRERELDYPSGSENVYNTYDGRGGISIGSFWRQLLFGKHLRDWRMLLTGEFTPDTKLLYRRTISARVKAIAPFLRFDNDPYLVVADATNGEGDNFLYWMIDAYTTSDHYPYSDPMGKDFNYIRNSVKVVVDALHGSVSFFVADPSDPIIQTWSRLFPGMFQLLEDMPPELLAHIRYPQDYFQVQSDQLMVYHMTDPQVFYNREDQWRAPNELYADKPTVVEPYYLIMRLPSESDEEFILLRPYTPNQRNNLIAWLAARADRIYQPTPRDNFSNTMLLYRFPKQKLVFGPEQLEARINQDPVISQRISLWNQRGSRAVQGNLLVIPIEESLLYVEPLYLEATINRLPILARVIVAYQSRIVMGETLDQSIRAIFEPAPAEDTIIRSIENELLVPEGDTVPPPDTVGDSQL